MLLRSYHTLTDWWRAILPGTVSANRPNHTSMASQNQVIYAVKYRVKIATYQEEKLNYWILYLKHGIIAIILGE
jgi:hypothetical protein